MLVGLLGILKAGGAYLPLDPRYPPERLSFMLADAGAPILVTHEALHLQLPVHGIRIVCLDAEAGAIAQLSASAPKSGLEPQNAAYVIYTSGSTGTPKSVVIDHASLTNKVLTLGMDFGAGPNLRVALLSSPGFDPSIEQATLPLVHGASIIVISDATRESPARFWDYVERKKVTLLNCTPSLIESLMRERPRWFIVAPSGAGRRALHDQAPPNNCATPQRCESHQFVWPDGNHDRCDRLCCPGRPARPLYPDRPPAAQLSCLRARSGFGAGPSRGSAASSTLPEGALRGAIWGARR